MSESRRGLVIRVVAMPADTNPDGDMFGGWVLSQMDLGAWIQARKHTRGPASPSASRRRWGAK